MPNLILFQQILKISFNHQSVLTMQLEEKKDKKSIGIFHYLKSI